MEKPRGMWKWSSSGSMLEDAAEVERPLGAVQRRTAHDVPTPPAEEQPVGAQPGDDFLLLLGQAVVADADVAAVGDGRRASDRRPACGPPADWSAAAGCACAAVTLAQLLAEAARAGVLSSFTAAVRAAPRNGRPDVAAQLVAQHQQRRAPLPA